MTKELSFAGATYRSFLITKCTPLPELHSTLIEAVHEPSGAKILHIANDDPENLFCLSFQTLPSTSNGVAHILEHTVLCGSRKFPVKDPFFSMTRRSLNTYMNALTGQDFTCYPASSQVEKDFYNLLEVYLDATFHPELKSMSFLQEGHRLEFQEPQNPKSPLLFQGVVYNEMKGAMASPDSRLWEAVMSKLTPDLPYAINSGGSPQEIPNLTYQELKEFHETFYHPSRCLFFFYGNLPLAKHLDFLQEHALTNVSKLAPFPPIPLQRRFSSPVAAEASYPVAAGEDLQNKTWIVFSWLTTPITEQGDVLALSLLDSLLMDTDASLLKMALLKSGLCSSVDSSLDTEMSEVPFSIVCKGCNPNAKEKLKKILLTTLEKCTFTKEQIEASLHQLEFQRTEIGAEGIPFGLTLFFRSALIQQHGSAPENGLVVHSLFQALRNHLQNPLFLKNLIDKYFLQNPHFVELVFSPDPLLDTKEKKEEEARLLEIRKTISESHVMAQAKELSHYQEAVESQSLDCLPKLLLRDVSPHTRDLSLQEMQVDHLHVFHHECFTNQILYADLVFDLPEIARKDLGLVSLYTKMLTELGCGGRNYEDTLHFAQSYTGGVSASLSLHISQKDPNLCKPSLSFKGKSLFRYSEKLLALFADFSQGVDLTDIERIKELIFQSATELQNRLVKSSLTYAVQTALSGFSQASFVYNEWNGFPYYQEILQWKDNPKCLAKELERIQELVLRRGSPHLVLSCGKEEFQELKAKEFFRIAQKIALKPLSPWTNHYELPLVPSQVRFIPAPVAFTAKGMRTVSYRDPQSPFFLLATELLDNCFLHKEVREKGGAYGSGASYSPQTGNFHLYSYRDPNFAKTLKAFDLAMEKIGNGKFSEQDLEEAKFGVLQSLDAPIPPGSRAMTAYAWKRAGRSLQDREQYRKILLHATRQEVQKAVAESLTNTSSCTVSFLSEDLYKKEHSACKTSFIVV